MLKKLLISAIFLSTSSQVAASNFSNEVLAIGVGARALGMGGAFSALADDSTAVYWNPAGLPKVKNIEIAVIQQGKELSSLGLNEVGSAYMFFSGAVNLKKLGTFGAAFMRFGVDQIPYVKNAPPPNTAPTIDGEFSTQDFAFMASWGKEFHPGLSVGITAKMLTGGTTGLDTDASYSFIGVDIGLLSNLGGFHPSLEGLSLGLNLQDPVSTGVQWSNTPTNPNEKVDLNPKVGIAYDAPFEFLTKSGNQARIAFDVDPKYGSNLLLHFGGEFWYKRTIAIRGGMRKFAEGRQKIEPSLGASVRYAILQVDYSFVKYELTPIHFMSLAVKF